MDHLDDDDNFDIDIYGDDAAGQGEGGDAAAVTVKAEPVATVKEEHQDHQPQPQPQPQQQTHDAPQPPPDQGAPDDDPRDIDPGATSALKISELQWWITEDDVRGWANSSRVEDQVRELTFHEHKVNGKSKG